MAATYDYYRIFYHVAQQKSFTRAAETIGSNQPNITRCMNNLEHELGCKLFVRSNRGISLTPEGERLYSHVALAVEQLRIGEEELRKDCSLEQGVVSIGTSETALRLLLLDRLTAFHRQYPGVRLRIINQFTPQASTALESGQIELAVATSPVSHGPNLRETALLTFREILVGGPSFYHLTRERHRLADMTSYPLVCMGSGSSTYEHYQLLFLTQNLRFRPDVEVTTMDQVLQTVEHNLGVGFVPEKYAALALAHDRVRQIELEETIPERRIVLLEDRTRPQSIAVETIKKMICGAEPVACVQR